MLVYVDSEALEAIFETWENKVATTGTFLILTLTEHFNFFHALICILHMILMHITRRHSVWEFSLWFCTSPPSSCLWLGFFQPYFSPKFSFTLVTKINEWNKVVHPFGLLWAFSIPSQLEAYQDTAALRVSKRTKTTTWKEASIAIRVTQTLAMHLPMWKNVVLWTADVPSLPSSALLYPLPSAIPHLECCSRGPIAFCPLGPLHLAFFLPLLLAYAYVTLKTKLLLL